MVFSGTSAHDTIACLYLLQLRVTLCSVLAEFLALMCVLPRVSSCLETILHLALHHRPIHALCSSSSLESILFHGPRSRNAHMQGSASVHEDVCLPTEVYQAPFLSFLFFLTFNETVTHPQSLWRTHPLRTHAGQMMSHWWHLWVCRFWAAGSASAVHRSVLKTWASAQKAFSGNSGRQRDLKEDCVAAWILKV